VINSSLHKYTGPKWRQSAHRLPLTKVVSYRAQVRVKGRPTQSETFPNLKEAKAWGASVSRDP